MNVLIYFFFAYGCLVTEMTYAEENLLRNGFAAVAVSTENIEAMYVQAIENDYSLYAQLGADWNSEGLEIDTSLAGIQTISEPKILFINDDSFNSTSEIAFEDTRPKNRVKLSMSDIAEINEALIISHIKSRSVDPKEFNVNLSN